MAEKIAPNSVNVGSRSDDIKDALVFVGLEAMCRDSSGVMADSCTISACSSSPWAGLASPSYDMVAGGKGRAALWAIRYVQITGSPIVQSALTLGVPALMPVVLRAEAQYELYTILVQRTQCDTLQQDWDKSRLGHVLAIINAWRVRPDWDRAYPPEDFADLSTRVHCCRAVCS